MSTSPTIITQTHAVEGGVIFEIVINRPKTHNCVNGDASRLLLEAWTRFRDDDALVVAIFRGAGDQAFCSGADLSALETLTPMNMSDAEIEKMVKQGTGPMGGSRIVQTKPVITMTQGHTYAGGLELFCHGHIRIAEEGARFSVACRRWGVPLVDGGTVFLPRLIGNVHALPLIITGQRIDAKRAHDIGLVWEVVPTGKGVDRAFSVARQLCALPRDAMLADLRSALIGAHLPIEDALELEARNLIPVATSESMQRGVEKFLNGARFWFE